MVIPSYQEDKESCDTYSDAGLTCNTLSNEILIDRIFTVETNELNDLFSESNTKYARLHKHIGTIFPRALFSWLKNQHLVLTDAPDDADAVNIAFQSMISRAYLSSRSLTLYSVILLSYFHILSTPADRKVLYPRFISLLRLTP